MVYHLGGVPVIGSPVYPGWFGSKVLFVDGDNGQDGYKGNRINRPKASIASAITEAGPYDTIYVRPKVPASDASDPTVYAEALTIPFAKHHLKLIGTSGQVVDPHYGPKLKSSETEYVITVNAPRATIEGFVIHRRNTNTGGVYLAGVTGYATLAGSVGTHLANCEFRYAGTGAASAVYIFGGYHSVVLNSIFVGCGTGWFVDSNTIPSRTHQLRNCDFVANNGVAVAGPWIYLYGNPNEVLIKRCDFDFTPTAAVGAYICSPHSPFGMVVDCNFNHTAITPSDGGADIDFGAGGEFRCINCWDSTALITA